MPNQELAEELHKPTIRKFEKGEIYSSFKDNIWGADLANMQLISKFNKGSRFLFNKGSCFLHVINIYSKYMCVAPLKDKTGIRITNVFQKILDVSNRRPYKI